VIEGRGDPSFRPPAFPARRKFAFRHAAREPRSNGAIQSFTRETLRPTESSAGGECATDLDAPALRIPLPNCQQHLGAGRHAFRTPIGGDMQRR
jgi:hypothetical protein